MQTIVAAFNDSATAQRAVDSLVQNGFSRSSIHLQSSYAGSTTGTGSTTSTDDTGHTGFFAGVEHFFSNLFSDDDADRSSHAGRYTDAVRGGRSVVAVDAMSDAQVQQATSLLDDLGAIDIDEQAGGGSTGGMRTMTGTVGAATAGLGAASIGGAGATSVASAEDVVAGGEAVVPVVEEELQVGKRTVDRGGIRVIRRVTETPVSELINLREERAVVERRPVDRPATEADFTQGEGTIEVRERAEEAVVAKTARVVEEVVVGKEATDRQQTVSDTVRHTDVEVERLDPTTATSGSSGSMRDGSLTGASTSGGSVTGGSTSGGSLTGG